AAARRLASAAQLTANLHHFSFSVSNAFGHFGQKVVGIFFLLKRLFEEICDRVQTQLICPSAHGAISRDLIVLHGLRRSDEAGVQRGLALELAGDLVALLEEALDSLALD